ncbi:MAG: ATP-binding domain-containing protein [Clostridiales bacterium]|nr:ATP-binding domain-containing protein [Clostridiales bacterium]
MPVLMTHYMMLQRSHIYTGISRAKKGLIIVGMKKPIGFAVRNVTLDKKNTMLAEMLK